MTSIAFTPNHWKIDKIRKDLEAALAAVVGSYGSINADEVLTGKLIAARESLNEAIQGIDRYFDKGDK